MNPLHGAAVLVTGLTLACAATYASQPVPQFDSIYAFGDSLTDTGNEPAEPYLHFDGRWSNGPLWVEYLHQRFGLVYDQSRNFARSGAQCDDTLRQVRGFVPTTDISRSLFVVWAGGNDFLQEYDKHWLDDAGWDGQTAYSVNQLSNAVVHLETIGARFILVPNTVDVTKIPTMRYLEIDGIPEIIIDFFRGYLRGKVRLFNERLAAALDRLRDEHPGIQIFKCDFYGRVNSLLEHADAYGFTETRVDALADVRLLDKRFDGPGADYVFWDPIHPTTKAHGFVADWFHAAVAPLCPEVAVAAQGAEVRFSVTDLHAGNTYTLELSADYKAWSNVQSFLSLSSNRTFSVSNNLPRAFFRLRWTR